MPVLDQAELPMTLLVPFKLEAGMELGKGYSYLEQKVGASAVSAPNSAPNNVTRSRSASGQLEIVYVTSVDDQNQLIAASVQGSGTVEGVKVKASLDFTKSIKYSETSETLVLTWYGDSAQFDKITSPALIQTALDLYTSDPEQFRRTYGEYFISGGWERAEFHAVYNLSATKAEDLTDFKASAEASVDGLFSTEGSSKFTQAAATHHISISVTLYHSATKTSDGKSKISADLTPAQVVEIFNEFKQNHVDGYKVAELTHYSSLAPTKISRLMHVPTSFFSDRARLLYAQNSYQGILHSGLVPKDLWESLNRRAVTEFDPTVSSTGTQYWGNPKQLTNDANTAEQLAKEARFDTDFVKHVKTLGNGDGGYSNVVRGGFQEVGIGTHGDKTIVPGGVIVHEEKFDLQQSYDGQERITLTSAKSYPGSIIIYLSVNDNWGGDNTGGSITGFTGGIGSDRVTFECKSDARRGLSWSFTVKYIELQPVGNPG